MFLVFCGGKYNDDDVVVVVITVYTVTTTTVLLILRNEQPNTLCTCIKSNNNGIKCLPVCVCMRV